MKRGLEISTLVSLLILIVSIVWYQKFCRNPGSEELRYSQLESQTRAQADKDPSASSYAALSHEADHYQELSDNLLFKRLESSQHLSLLMAASGLVWITSLIFLLALNAAKRTRTPSPLRQE